MIMQKDILYSYNYYDFAATQSKNFELQRARIDPHKQRVTQTNMVYLISLPEWMAREEILRSKQYCGQYGTIIKVMIKKNYFNQSPSYSAYITYSNDQAACVAILGINNLVFEKNKIYASYGTNKYCAQFIKFGRCRKEECPFFHQISPQKQISQGDNKKLFQEQQDLAKSYFILHHQRIIFDAFYNSVFPKPSDILQRFMKQGLIQPISRKSSMEFQCLNNGNSIISLQSADAKSQASTESSPSKGSCDYSSELSIQERILLKLSVPRKSIFQFVQKQGEMQYSIIDEVIRGAIRPFMCH